MIKLLELFGGIGAPRKALENIGINIKSIDYVEVLPQAVNAYNRLFDNNYKPQDIIKWNMNVDILVHGSPCQDFSTAGLNDMGTGRSILYERTLEIIEKLLNPRPKYILWENVVGLLNKKNRRHFNHYLDKMEQLGYDNYFEVLNAKDFGIPQNRDRIYVVSIRKDIEHNFSFNYLKREKLQDITEFLEKEVSYEDRYTFKQPSMIKALKMNKVNIILDSANTITKKQVRWNNAGLVFRDLSLYEKFKGFKRKYKSNGLRLCEVEKVIGKVKDFENTFRYITEREAWLLQGFTNKDFDKVKDFKSADLYNMAGNSIPVKVLESIFKELLF